jgi:hypothetical protein
MKKILFYFDCTILTSRAIDLIKLLKHKLDFDVYFHELDDHSKWILVNIHNYNNINTWNKTDINQFEIVFYDNTSWERGMSKINEYVKSFKKKLVCINYEDGQEFYLQNLEQSTIDKTLMFINNALYVDKDRYIKQIHGKLFLTTSYITNSQLFKNKSINVNNKKPKVYFTGSLTGNPSKLTNFSESEKYFRYDLVKKIFNNKKYDSYLKFFNCDPSYRNFFNDIMENELKGDTTKYHSQEEYSNMMIESMFCIAVKGNSLPTNRLHESQAAGCISITNNFDEVEIYGVGVNNKTFIEINIDLSDVEEKIEYCINNIDFAKNIMYNSRNNWETYNMLDEDGLYSPVTQKYHTDAFKKYGLI